MTTEAIEVQPPDDLFPMLERGQLVLVTMPRYDQGEELLHLIARALIARGHQDGVVLSRSYATIALHGRIVVRLVGRSDSARGLSASAVWAPLGVSEATRNVLAPCIAAAGGKWL